MLQVEYSTEASFYFYDNGKLTFDLHVAIETLVFSGGIPTVGDYVEVEPGEYVWTYLGHDVVYDIQGNRLIVHVVAPVE